MEVLVHQAVVVLDPVLQQQLVRDVGELPPRRHVAGRPAPADALDEADALDQHGLLLLGRHRDRVLVRVAVHADLVAGVHDHLRLLGEGLDRVARDEPGRLQAVLVEQLQEAAASRPRPRTGRARCRPASPRRRRSRASRRPRRRRRRCCRRSPSPSSPPVSFGATTLRHVCSLRGPSGGALGRAGRRPPGARLPGEAREPGARSLRFAPRRLGRTSLRPARPQGPLGRRRQPRRRSGSRRSVSRGGSSTRSTRPWCARLADGKLPVVLVTGFLGSGKTTLISSLLGHPAWARRR